MRAQMKKYLPVLIAGLVLGFLLGLSAGWFVIPKYRSHGHRMDRFISELHLDALQEAKVRSILEEQRRQMKAIKEELKPRFDALREEGLVQIRRELNASQQTKLDDIESKRRHKKEKRSGE